MRIELTDRGTVRIDAEAARRMDTGAGVLVRTKGDELTLTFLAPGAIGGLILKQTSAAGDRAVLVIEQIRDLEWTPGPRDATWDQAERTLTVPLFAPDRVKELAQ